MHRLSRSPERGNLVEASWPTMSSTCGPGRCAVPRTMRRVSDVGPVGVTRHDALVISQIGPVEQANANGANKDGIFAAIGRGCKPRNTTSSLSCAR